jgi:hypothetical protein
MYLVLWIWMDGIVIYTQIWAYELGYLIIDNEIV